MKYKTVIFDLDGTLLNTLDDLADSVNFALEKNGMPKRSLEEVRSFVGNGIKLLVQRALNGDGESELFKQTFKDFKAHYAKNCLNKTAPYDGILQAVQTLKSNGIKTAVVSNKADFAVKSLCENVFNSLFDFCLGETDGMLKKPAPDMVNTALKELEAEPESALYVGDSDVDILTAKNSGLDFIGVSWGFRGKEFLFEHGCKVAADSTDELLNLILQ